MQMREGDLEWNKRRRSPTPNSVCRRMTGLARSAPETRGPGPDEDSIFTGAPCIPNPNRNNRSPSYSEVPSPARPASVTEYTREARLAVSSDHSCDRK